MNADAPDVNANTNHLHCNGISSDIRGVESLTSGHQLDDAGVEDVRSVQETGDLLGEFGQAKSNLPVTSGVAYAQSKLALILFTRKLALKFGNSKFYGFIIVIFITFIFSLFLFLLSLFHYCQKFLEVF